MESEVSVVFVRQCKSQLWKCCFRPSVRIARPQSHRTSSSLCGFCELANSTLGKPSPCTKPRCSGARHMLLRQCPRYSRQKRMRSLSAHTHPFSSVATYLEGRQNCLTLGRWSCGIPPRLSMSLCGTTPHPPDGVHVEGLGVARRHSASAGCRYHDDFTTGRRVCYHGSWIVCAFQVLERARVL